MTWMRNYYYLKIISDAFLLLFLSEENICLLMMGIDDFIIIVKTLT